MTRQAKPSRYIPNRIRDELANLPCALCGQKLKEPRMHIDHVVAIADGGTSERSNLRKLCYLCNQRRKHAPDSQVAAFKSEADRRFERIEARRKERERSLAESTRARLNINFQ